MKVVLRRHPNATIIWAHTGVWGVVRPIKNHAEHIEEILADPGMRHVHFDLSWDEVAKYIVATPEATNITAELIACTKVFRSISPSGICLIRDQPQNPARELQEDFRRCAPKSPRL